MADAPTIPGGRPVLGHTVPLLRRPLKFLSSPPVHGELVRVRLGPMPVYLATTPELAWRILVVDAGNYDKGIVFDKMRPLFGDGLATANGEVMLKYVLVRAFSPKLVERLLVSGQPPVRRGRRPAAPGDPRSGGRGQGVG